MIVNGKLVWYDLSRFNGGAIKPAALCDLMSLPEFVVRLEDENEISDAWIIQTVLDLKNEYCQRLNAGIYTVDEHLPSKIRKCKSVLRKYG